MTISDKIRRYSKGIKVRVKKTQFGEIWQDPTYVEKHYDKMVEDRPLMTRFIIDYLSNKRPKSSLEIGCGAGIFPIKFKNLFQEYTGVDIGKPAIDHCKANSNFEFVQGDFIKMDLKKKYDLVFTQSVIDHVYDPDAFLTNVVNHTKKYALVSAYRGFFPDYPEHRVEYFNRGGFYHNELSAKKLGKILGNLGLSEKQFSITRQANGRNLKNPIRNFDTVIEIEI